MTHITVVQETPLIVSPRVMQASAMMDLPASKHSRLEWDVNLPLEEREWQVGLIVGPSGAGKSSIARSFFGDRLIERFDWPVDRSILDGFPEDMGIKDVIGLLTAVGFGSAPSWFRPFHALSNGEQFRVTMARALAESDGMAVIDEFTSVVDRQVAQVASSTVQKLVRRSDRRFVAVSCHYDILEWLQPDWVYQPHTNQFDWRCLQRRPTIDLEIYPVDYTAWRTFKPYHYLSADLHKAAACFGGFIGDHCVAFTSYLHLPHPKTRNIKMGQL